MCDVVYNTPMNTVGVGDPVPFGMHECGSGDVFNPVFTSKKRNVNSKGKTINVAMKKAAPNIGSFGMQQQPLLVYSKKK